MSMLQLSKSLLGFRYTKWHDCPASAVSNGRARAVVHTYSDNENVIYGYSWPMNGGFLFRWDGSFSNYYRVVFQGDRSMKITRVKGGVTTDLLTTGAGVIPATTWKDIEIKFKDNKIVVDVAGSVYSVVDTADPLLIQGMPGIYSYYGLNSRWDDFQVWAELTVDEYGLILNYTRAGSTVKIALDGVIFPEGSIPSPKNAPVFITSNLRARKIKFIA